MSNKPVVSPSNALVSLARQAAGLGPLHITPKQKYAALAVAGIIDVLQATVLSPVASPGAMSPVEWAIDIGTAVILTLILGWNWRLLLAFGVELIPMASMFPTWSALILTITSVASVDAKTGAAGSQPAGSNAIGVKGVESLPGAAPPVAGVPEKFPGTYHKRSR